MSKYKLLQIRMKLVTDMTKQVQNSSAPVGNTGAVKQSQRQQLQIIDTTLLKCYLQVQHNNAFTYSG